MVEAFGSGSLEGDGSKVFVLHGFSTLSLGMQAFIISTIKCTRGHPDSTKFTALNSNVKS